MKLNPRNPKGYWSHTKPQKGSKRPYRMDCLYELAQVFSMIDLFFHVVHSIRKTTPQKSGH